MKKALVLILCMVFSLVVFTNAFAEDVVEQNDDLQVAITDIEIVEEIDLDADEEEDISITDFLEEADDPEEDESEESEDEEEYDEMYAVYCTLDSWLESMNYALGYLPDYAINEEERVAYIYFFTDHIAVPILYDEYNGVILINEDYYPGDLIDESQLWDAIPEDEYYLLSWLNTDGFIFEKYYDKEENGVEIDLMSENEGYGEYYTFYVPNVVSVLSDGDMVIDSESYRQIYYSLNRYRD